MRLVGPSWIFVVVGLMFVAAGLVCAGRPAVAWRLRQVADQDDRAIAPSARVQMAIRVIGAVVAAVGVFVLVGVITR